MKAKSATGDEKKRD